MSAFGRVLESSLRDTARFAAGAGARAAGSMTARPNVASATCSARLVNSFCCGVELGLLRTLRHGTWLLFPHWRKRRMNPWTATKSSRSQLQSLQLLEVLPETARFAHQIAVRESMACKFTFAPRSWFQLFLSTRHWELYASKRLALTSTAYQTLNMPRLARQFATCAARLALFNPSRKLSN